MTDKPCGPTESVNLDSQDDGNWLFSFPSSDRFMDKMTIFILSS